MAQTITQIKYYANRRKAGQCRSCGTMAGETLYCARCRVRERKRVAAYRAKKKAEKQEQTAR